MRSCFALRDPLEFLKELEGEHSTKEQKLAEEIEELKFDAYRRRELHDDPVGAEELEELAERKAQELQALQCA